MHPLELILQLQVGSDQAAVSCLPSIVSSLTPSHFEPSPHLQKWISRVTSLIHSKQPGARWAGLCLALQTSILDKRIMVEASQSWIAITLPILSSNETPPTWKACIRLLEFLFSSTINMAEFQRQLALPNVPKFSAALLSLAEKSEDRQIRRISMVTLTRLVPLYPTLHRQLNNSIFKLSFRFLSGSSTSPTPQDVILDACNLHAVLHFTGGKVGAAALWRKSLDTALANAWSAFTALRITFLQPSRSTLNVSPTFDFFPSDPVITIPLNLDRLRCSIALINHLLRAVTSRAVPVPIGELTTLAHCLLGCTPNEEPQVHLDNTRRALETSVIPGIWEVGCIYASQLVKSLRHHVSPHLTRMISYITHHLEQSLPKSHRIWFLRLLPPLLSCNIPLHSPIAPTRLMKALLPIIAALLPRKSEVQEQSQEAYITASKKGKKRTRGYEGDEVFKVGVGVLCSTLEDGEILEIALDALDSLLWCPHLSAPIRLLAIRLLVTLLLEIPRHSPSALSHDQSFHGRVHAKILALCNKHVLAGSSGWINNAVGLVVNAMEGAMYGSEPVLDSDTGIHRGLDILLHPRLPPLLRSQPPVEELSLFSSGSSKADKAAQNAVGLNTIEVVRVIRETPATEVTTIQKTNKQPSIPSALPLWSTAITATPPALPAMPASILTSSIALTPSLSAMREVPDTEKSMPNIPSTSTITQIPSIETFREPVAAQQSNVSASDSVVLGFSRTQGSNSDEEMPEIDTRSDSD